MLSFSGLMFQLTGGASCTHQPCIFDIAFIYLIHHYTWMCLSCCSNLSAVHIFFLLREKAWWQLSKSLSCNLTILHLYVCMYVCVCVCVSVSYRNHKNNKNMNRNRRDYTNELLTAEADTLVQGISETVSVLAWGVTRRLRGTGEHIN